MSSKKPDSYQKLTDLLDEWFDKSLTDIPKEIQKTIKSRYEDWSKLTPKQRRRAAESMDKPFEPLQHDPEAEELDQRDFELVFELHKWENMDAKGIPSEEAIKEKKIQEIKKEIDKVGASYKHLSESNSTGVKDPKLIERNQKLQERVDELHKGDRTLSHSKICLKIEKETKKPHESIRRITKKTW